MKKTEQEKIALFDVILDRAYTIREFSIFIDKPFEEAKKQDMGSYIDYKTKSKEKAVRK